MSETFEYVGDELQLFAAAKNWKRRLRRELRHFIRGDVLEVGAGIGSTTAILRDLTSGSWTSLEPDYEMAEQLAQAVHVGFVGVPLEVAEDGEAELVAIDLVEAAVRGVDVQFLRRDQRVGGGQFDFGSDGSLGPLPNH